MGKNFSREERGGDRRAGTVVATPKAVKAVYEKAIGALKNFDVNPYELRNQTYAETEAVVAVLPPTISVVGEEFTTT